MHNWFLARLANKLNIQGCFLSSLFMQTKKPKTLVVFMSPFNPAVDDLMNYQLFYKLPYPEALRSHDNL